MTAPSFVPDRPPIQATFDGPWPQVLHEVLEFIRLQHLAHLRGRRCRMLLLLAKALVPAHAVQPALGEFSRQLKRDYPGLQQKLHFDEGATHRVVLERSR